MLKKLQLHAEKHEEERWLLSVCDGLYEVHDALPSSETVCTVLTEPRMAVSSCKQLAQIIEVMTKGRDDLALVYLNRPLPWTISLAQLLQPWPEQPPGQHSMGSAGLQLSGSAGWGSITAEQL